MSIDITTLALAKEYTNRMVGPGGTGSGVNGKDGITPHIGDNGNWFIGTVDTEVSAQGPAGENGVTPHIGTNGNWYIGSVNTGVSAKGAKGDNGLDGNGIKSAILNSDYTLTLTFDDGTTYTTPSIRGATGDAGSAGKNGTDGKDGSDGVGIASIKQTTTSTADGGNNVFTVTLTNGTTATFIVKNGSKGSTGKDGSNGVDGGHYTPVVTQPTTDTMQISFAPSKSDMPAVNPVTVNLPVSENSGQNLNLDTTLTQPGQAADAKATGDEIKRVEELIPSIEGLAKSEDIPTKPEDIGAQPAGSYLTDETDPTVPGWAKQPEKPTYTASEVGARSADWMPTAQEVGALPSTTVIPTVPTKVSAFTNDAGYLTEHQDIGGKLDADKLPEAVEDALAQAKASGEFDGKNGDPGVSPTVAVSAITGGHRISITDKSGTKTVDVMDGEDGDPGRGIKSIARTSGNGAAGTTDTYTITYTDNTTGTFQVRNGANGAAGTAATFAITGATALAYGATPTITEQSDSTAQARRYALGIPAGKPGEPGKTPVRGTDYWTPTDKAEIVQSVIDQMGLMILGQMDGGNTITLTETLPDGTYTLRCINADGSTTELCEFVVGNTGPAYTNLADPTSADWLTNKRINSSSTLVDVTEQQRGDDTVVITNFVDLAGVSKLYIKGLDVLSALSSGQNYGRFYLYNSNKELIVTSSQPSKFTYVTVSDYDPNVWVVDVPGYLGEWGYQDERYCRWGGILTGTAADVIITADEPIV